MLTFEPAVTSITLTIDWITDAHQPVETLSAFATDRGAGVLTYSGQPFKKFTFRHQHHPRNIGFMIKKIQATFAPIKCP